MDGTNLNPTPSTPSTPSGPTQPSGSPVSFSGSPLLAPPKKKTWVWVVVIVVVLLIAFLIYEYWVYKSLPKSEEGMGALSGEQGGTITAPDELSSTEEDLQATDLEGLGKELGDIQAELNQ